MKKIQLISRQALTIIFLLSATTNSYAGWTQKAGVNTPGPGRWGSMSFVIGDKIFVGGGYTGNFTNANDFQNYDPATNQWQYLAGMPGTNTSRTAGVAFAISGKGYLGLGAQDYNGFNPAPTYLKDLWEYNATADTWAKKADLPDSGRTDAIYFTIGTKAYVVGGKTGGTSSSNDTWEYDPATNTWTAKAAYPGTIEEGAGFSLNGKGYVVGGIMNGSATNKVYEYNPSTNTWTEKTAYPETEITGPTAFVASNKAFVGLGGIKPLTPAAQYPKYFWSYDAISNKWAYAGGFEMTASGRMYGIAQVVGGKAYVGAGWRLDNGSNQTFFFDFYQADPVAAANITAISKKQTSIYPNPAGNYIHVDVIYHYTNYTITDIAGRTIKSGSIQPHGIHISDIVPGAYTLNLSTGNGTIASMFIKQ